MKKLMVILLLLSSIAYADGDAVYLPKDKPAPFSGYLLSPTQADRVHDVDVELKSQQKINSLLLQEQDVMGKRITNANDTVENLSKQVVSMKDNSFLTKAGFFLFGAVLTGFVSYGVVKTLK